MFGCTRLPGAKRDTFVKWKGADPPNHIVITHKGHFWKMHFGGARGKDVSFVAVKGGLKKIIEASRSSKLRPSNVGALTCDDRDTWAENREKLRSIDASNEASLKDIDEALFVVALGSDEGPREDGESELELTMKAAVHGNPRHRWFDKPCTIIVTAAGKVCSNCEHSWGDGIAMMRWGQELVKEVLKPSYKLDAKVDASSLMAKAMSDPQIMGLMVNPRVRPIAKKIKADPSILLKGAAAFADEFAADPELAVMFKGIAPNLAALVAGAKPAATPCNLDRISFKLNEELETAIEEAGRKADALAASTKRSILLYDTFGAGLLKKSGMSPDAVMQQALLLAYFKRHNKFVSAYCVAQHMAFKAGRNERMRSNTGISKK